jgi:hypothetical protein
VIIDVLVDALILIFRRHTTVEQQKLKILNLRSSYILTRLVPLVEQELLTLPEHLSLHRLADFCSAVSEKKI